MHIWALHIHSAYRCNDHVRTSILAATWEEPYNNILIEHSGAHRDILHTQRKMSKAYRINISNHIVRLLKISLVVSLSIQPTPVVKRHAPDNMIRIMTDSSEVMNVMEQFIPKTCLLDHRHSGLKIFRSPQESGLWTTCAGGLNVSEKFVDG